MDTAVEEDRPGPAHHPPPDALLHQTLHLLQVRSHRGQLLGRRISISTDYQFTTDGRCVRLNRYD